MTMKTRKRRDNTTAAKLRVGDLFEPIGLGIRATVTHVGTHPSCLEPHVLIRYAFPNDFSVNANFRGQSGGAIVRPSDAFTRWLSPKAN